MENGEAKHMLAPRVTAKRNANGLTLSSVAALKAMGAISTAVAVLLINIVSNDIGPYLAYYEHGYRS